MKIQPIFFNIFLLRVSWKTKELVLGLLFFFNELPSQLVASELHTSCLCVHGFLGPWTGSGIFSADRHLWVAHNSPGDRQQLLSLWLTGRWHMATFAHSQLPCTTSQIIPALLCRLPWYLPSWFDWSAIQQNIFQIPKILAYNQQIKGQKSIFVGWRFIINLNSIL